MDEDAEVNAEGGSSPGTYGELRRWLKEQGDPWAVDPLASDEEPLPDFPLGGLSEREDEIVAAARLGEDVDVRSLIAQLPPNNPDLRRRWEEAGMPVDRVPEALTGDRPDTAHRRPGGREPDGEPQTESDPEDDAS
jgi:hypothetical protein